MKTVRLLTRIITVLATGCCVASCVHNSRAVSQAEYSKEIVGLWLGTVAGSKETMSMHDDGTFVCQVRASGFLANTLSQGITGSIYGTWKIVGQVITLKIVGSANVQLENKVALSTIVSFKHSELQLKSDDGEISTFRRAFSL